LKPGARSVTRFQIVQYGVSGINFAERNMLVGPREHAPAMDFFNFKSCEEPSSVQMKLESNTT
jgi:hypothetical protein